jgi:hypothetical protein
MDETAPIDFIAGGVRAAAAMHPRRRAAPARGSDLPHGLGGLRGAELGVAGSGALALPTAIRSRATLAAGPAWGGDFARPLRASRTSFLQSARSCRVVRFPHVPAASAAGGAVLGAACAQSRYPAAATMRDSTVAIEGETITSPWRVLPARHRGLHSL